MTAKACKVCGRALHDRQLQEAGECGDGLLCEGRRRGGVARAAGLVTVGEWGQVLFRAGVVEHRMTDPHYRSRTGIRLEPEPWVPAWARAVAELGKKVVKGEVPRPPEVFTPFMGSPRTYQPPPRKIYEVPISAPRRAELIHRIAFGIGMLRDDALGEAAARARDEKTMAVIATAVDWRPPWAGWPKPRPPRQATYEEERDGVIFAGESGSLFSTRQIPLGGAR